jgi:signal peptidase I
MRFLRHTTKVYMQVACLHTGTTGVIRMKSAKNNTTPGGENDEKKKTKLTLRAFIRDLVVIVILITAALVLKSNTVELFKIPTGSMEPTLYGAGEMGKGFGDHILVQRFAYGLTSKVKVPIIGKNLPLPKYHIMKRMPKVGEVVVFESPVDKRIDYIKRCCGTPGDRVRISNGLLHVNDRVVTNISGTRYTNQGILSDRFGEVYERVNSITKERGNDAIKDAIYINGIPYRDVERMKNGRTIVFSDNLNLDTFNDVISSEIVVPSNSFFMLGDNSAHSSDSRFWGFATMDHLKGRAWVVYLPIKRIRIIH